jgi:flagellar basal body P-ring formation protein FlgA
MNARVFLVLILVTAAFAADSLTITLHPEIQVDRPFAVLGEIADCSGPDAEAAALVVVQELPDLEARRITPERVRAALATSFPKRSIAISGETRLSRAVETISVERQRVAAEAWLSKEAGAGVEISFSRLPQVCTVPADRERPCDLVVEGLVRERIGNVPMRIRISRDGRELARSLTVAVAAQVADLAVPTRTMNRGERLQLGDLRTERIDLATGHYETAALADLIGKEVRMTLTADAPIPQGALREPPLILGGATVELQVTSDRFIITTSAVALSDGIMGDTINVRRATDGKQVQARVIGEGQVSASP